MGLNWPTEAQMQGRSSALDLIRAMSAMLACVLAGGAAAQDPKNIIAAQLRSQGYACDQPKSATRNSKISKPNETVWVLVCEHATYRATLVPNMAAQVELLSENDEGSSAPR
jgi:hypothetical protein